MPLPPSNLNTMSSNLRMIVDSIETYSKETEIDVAEHPFSTKLQGIDTPGQVLQLYQARAKNLNIKNYLGRDQILMVQLPSVVHTLYLLSGLLGKAVHLVCGWQSTTTSISFNSCATMLRFRTRFFLSSTPFHHIPLRAALMTHTAYGLLTDP